MARSAEKQRDKDSGQQAISDELRDQYFHDVVLMTANHVPGKENTNQARDNRCYRHNNFVFHVVLPLDWPRFGYLASCPGGTGIISLSSL
jgi:hypothetical protein